MTTSSVLTKEQLHILQHALGVDRYGLDRQGCREYYRNRFLPGGDDVERCELLAQRGLMAKREAPNFVPESHYFTVTDAGKLVVEQDSPRPPRQTRSRQRYRRYLEVADLFDSFRAFLVYEARTAVNE